MAIVLTVAMVSSSKSWFLCACAFVPGANLAPSNEVASATNFPVRQICVNFCNNRAFLCTSMKLGKLAECYPINNIGSGAILNLTFGDLYELINLIIMYTIN